MQRDAVAIIRADRIISNLQLWKLYRAASSGLRGANHHPQELQEANVVATYLLSYYLAKKQSLHVRSQDLKILTLIGENKRN